MSEQCYRTDATQFYDKDQVLCEIDRLKFAVASLVELLGKPGSYEQETGHNAARGIKARLDYLHDSVRLLLERKAP
jgi:hypothetical protein